MAEPGSKNSHRVPKKAYKRELQELQRKLVDLQEWVRASGARVVVVFEGRDAAGKGGVIKRVTEFLSPRVARTVGKRSRNARLSVVPMSPAVKRFVIDNC